MVSVCLIFMLKKLVKKMTKLCITLACAVVEEQSENIIPSMNLARERCFSFFLTTKRNFYTHSDLDRWIDFAQGFLKENYGAQNIRITSVSELHGLFNGSMRSEYIRVLDFEYLMVSYDKE